MYPVFYLLQYGCTFRYLGLQGLADTTQVVGRSLAGCRARARLAGAKLLAELYGVFTEACLQPSWSTKIMGDRRNILRFSQMIFYLLQDGCKHGKVSETQGDQQVDREPG